MNEAHTEQLYRECPILFGDHTKSMRETCMCWGFECGDGWFDLIFTLSRKIEAIVTKLPTEERPVAMQVKEKFGGLRFYMTSHHDEIEKLISQAEYDSERTCETCGKPGTLHTDGWWRCLCDICEDAYQTKRRSRTKT